MAKSAFDILSQADTAEPMHHLVHRLNYPAAQARPTRTIAFIAARGGEGTSTVVQGYCKALAEETAQKIIIVHSAPSFAYGLVDAVMDGRPSLEAVETRGAIARVNWLSNNLHRAAAIKMMQEGEWQKSLLEHYDVIVIDAPALQYGFDGILLAARADVTVIVTEAEKTPQPVIENLRNTLFTAGATIAGVVMNKRRYYIPQKLYKRL